MIADSGFSSLKAHLIASTGLAYYCDRDQDLYTRIGARIAELGLPDCSAYSDLLEDPVAGSGEMEVIVARINIGETYFFRDEAQLDAIRDVALAEILERKRDTRQLRIWSAGCGNGAEAYSLSILLERDLRGRLADWQVSILASDISQPSLLEAAAGIYGDWALRSTPETIRNECFTRNGSHWTIRPEYRRLVSFANINLVAVQGSEFGEFDLILCRNVMIYFAPELKRQLIGRFRQALSSGGWFVVGAVEHDLESFQPFRTVPASGATLYQKTAQGESPKADSKFEWIRPTPETPRLPIPVVEPTAATGTVQVDTLRLLADRGEWNQALDCCRQLLLTQTLNPAVHFYHALVLEHLGVVEEAERSLRQAIYLDRRFLLAHYQLGLVLTKSHKPRPAAQAFENVLTLSAGMAGEQAVANGDGITVADLQGLAKMHLQYLLVTT